jgi:O-antigen ligase
MNVVDVVALVVLLGCAYRAGAARRALAAVTPFLLWVVLFYAYGTAISTDAVSSASYALSRIIVGPVALVCVAFALRSRAGVRMVANVIALSCVINAILCVMQSSNHAFAMATSGLAAQVARDSALVSLRPAGLWNHPDETAIFFALGFALSHWARKDVAWAGRVAAVVGAFYTGSRVGVYSLAVFVTAFALFRLSRPPIVHTAEMRMLWIGRNAALAVSVALLGFALVGSVSTGAGAPEAADPMAFRIRRFANPLQEGERGSRRAVAAIWLDQALRSPWWGSGLGTFSNTPHLRLSRVGAHNMFIAVLGETGVFGLLGFLSVLGIGIVRAATARIGPEDKCVLVAAWVVWLIACNGQHTFLAARTYFVVWGLLYALPIALRVADRPRTAGPRPPTWGRVNAR